jgi:hypothetical protein
MIAYCGLNCAECPAFKATQANDDKLRAECARTWSIQYKHDIKPDQINCTGCKSTGQKFFFCRICGVAKCAVERGLNNCTKCPDAPCEKLQDMMAIDPNVKKSFEGISNKNI